MCGSLISATRVWLIGSHGFGSGVFPISLDLILNGPNLGRLWLPNCHLHFALLSLVFRTGLNSTLYGVRWTCARYAPNKHLVEQVQCDDVRSDL